MDISINGANSQVNLQELLAQQELKGKNLDGTESGSSVVLNGDSVTISASDPVTGGTVARTVSADKTGFKALRENAVQSLYAGAAMTDEIVDLLSALANECGLVPTGGSSGANVSKMTLAEVGEALKTEATASSEDVTGGTVIQGDDSSTHTFFDIYACMTLLQQVGQQERDAARELKMAELSNEISSILTQANKQREAGVLGAIVSAVTMTAQLALMTVSISKSASSIKSSYSTGVAQDTSLAESKAGTLQAQGKGSEAAQANLNKIQSKTSPEVRAKVDGALKEAGVPEARQELATLEEQETQLTQQRDEIAKKNANDPAIKDLDGKITEVQGAKTKAQTKCLDAMKTAQESLSQDYAAASGDTRRAETAHIQENTKATAGEVTTCRQTQKTAGSACKLMDAEIANEQAKLGIKPSPEEIVGAQRNAEMANKEMVNNPTFMSAQNRPWNTVFQSLPNMVGQLGQSCATMAHDLASADATAEQANQKTAEMYRDEANSLLQQAQDLIASARDCFKAVVQAESQSIEQIIRA